MFFVHKEYLGLNNKKKKKTKPKNKTNQKKKKKKKKKKTNTKNTVYWKSRYFVASFEVFF